MKNQSDWLSRIDDSVKITQINMPGTHDSAACFVAYSFISRTQKLSINEQLDAGVRYFDLRFELKDDAFYATHSIARCKIKKGFLAPKMTADDVVNYCKEFLGKNPSETILFQLKEAVSHTGQEFFFRFYDKYIENNDDLWFLENRIPALGEVRGKIVLLRAVEVDSERFNDRNSGINFSGYPYVGTTDVDNWQKSEIKCIDNENAYANMFVQDSYKVEGNKKWGTVKRFLESELESDDFNINLASCTRFFTPKYNAEKINRQLKNYDFSVGKTYGIVAVDFTDSELCDKIIKTNN